jgi:hypothetical protein
MMHGRSGKDTTDIYINSELKRVSDGTIINAYEANITNNGEIVFGMT